jgi:hypothetical protein
MSRRSKPKAGQTIVAPTAERHAHGRVERVRGQIADERGNPARPFRAVDTLEIMMRRGSISPAMRQAGDDFRRDFRRSGFDQLRAALLDRLKGGGERLIELRPDATRRVRRALIALGGATSPAGSCAWHVLGLEENLREWAIRQGWSGRAISEKTASGILIAALGVLAIEYGRT